MKIKLNNGNELSLIMVSGGPRYVQGTQRDTLNFVFPADVGMDTIDEAFTETACERITIMGDDGGEDIHKGYTIRAGLTKASVELEKSTPDAEAVYEDRITVSMSQRTYTETQLKNMESAMAALAGVEV